MNLFNNDLYATAQKQRQLANGYRPEVRVTFKGENGQLVIKIRDNGISIYDSFKSKHFQPFFTTKSAGQETGLGLLLSNDIITIVKI